MDIQELLEKSSKTLTKWNAHPPQGLSMTEVEKEIRASFSFEDIDLNIVELNLQGRAAVTL